MATTPQDCRRPMTNVELAENLCAVSVPLRESRRVHLDAHPALVPHVFMSCVLKRIAECLLAGPAHAPIASDEAEIRGILGVLERGLAEGDRETRNVIAISFSRYSEVELFFDRVLPLLGPRARAQLDGR